MRRRWDSAPQLGAQLGSGAARRLRLCGVLTLATSGAFAVACGGRSEQTDNRGGELYLGDQSGEGFDQPGAMQGAPATQGAADGSQQNAASAATAGNPAATNSGDADSAGLDPSSDGVVLLSEDVDDRELERSETLEITGLELIDDLGNCRLWLDSAGSGLEPDDVTVTFEDEAWPAANPCIDQASWGLLRNTDGTFLDLCPAGCQVVQANPDGVLVVEALYWTDPGVRLAR